MARGGGGLATARGVPYVQRRGPARAARARYPDLAGRSGEEGAVEEGDSPDILALPFLPHVLNLAREASRRVGGQGEGEGSG